MHKGPNARSELNAGELAQLDSLIGFHESNGRLLELARKSLVALVDDAPELRDTIHSYRIRLKTRTSMERKLINKIMAARETGVTLDISPDNFYSRINDAIGLRLIHLSLTQFPTIHAALLALLPLGQYTLVEAPFAQVIDTESDAFFRSVGLDVKTNDRNYISVHYVIAPIVLQGKAYPWSAEIQVRTIAQEAWGEVDHRFNYPDHHPDAGCQDQIRALALQMLGAARSIDAIFRATESYNRRRPAESDRL